MTIRVGLYHRTGYSYDRHISLGPQVVRLRPAPHCRTPIKSYSLKITPDDHWINWQQDPFGNYLARLVFPERTDRFEVVVDLVAEMVAINPFDFFVEDSASEYPFTYEPHLAKDLKPYLEADPAGPKLQALIDAFPRDAATTIDFLVALNQRLSDEVAYIIRMEPGVQAPEDTLEKGKGSCRDSGWLLVQLCRHLGLAARFVSGYLIQLTADQKAIDGPSGPETDFTDLHAWTEVYIPGAGWIGLDPTSGLLAGEGHIPLAATPAPISAAPITGTHEAAKVSFDYEMSVRRVYEAPRVTKPYSDEQWQGISALGQAVDRRLEAGDVRLTLGGEPTFVASTDRDAAEWNTAAVGPTKQHFADNLVRRLRNRFAPGGMLHHGQGKWYPGEPLPRWAYGLYWRADGEPLWREDRMVAREAARPARTVEDAAQFAGYLCEALGIDSGYVSEAYEDSAHFVMREQTLPVNVDPRDSKLEDAQERSRLARVFERGLTTPSSYVLPVQAWQARAHADVARHGRRYRWASERWKTRRGRLFLIPGDSPAGFRLPLQSLSYLTEGENPQIHALDPFAARGALPTMTPTMQVQTGTVEQITSRQPEFAPVDPGGVFVGGDPAVRTALAVEPRDGILYVFMPPTESADHYVDLLNAIEETAERLSLPVRIEGYPPPPDWRLNVIKVTPDPGVIEVNVHPASSWREQVEITEGLYEEARQSGLETAKFMIDGRPSGTGGGNHVVVGGKRTEDSPFLRRPDLLASLIRYWQNHPSLSFLFSGLFIGPTSQAPRIDEARDDQLYEMEMALAQVPSPSGARGHECPPWLVDRIFRNLLVDVSGNTHRAEICIDKLYSPDGPTGRLGLVEFRAFEMPPHPRMSLAQQLLLKALIALFWQTPYERPLIRYGNALHDQFMLPHYVWQDFLAVLADLDRAGMHFDPAWFLPFQEFRFPAYGAVQQEGIRLELRAALEPWHVLGEEGIIGGTARYVDSSLERLEVKVTGRTSKRYTVSCNEISLPLRPTDRFGEEVVGVRFRAWQPPACLHPTIGIHSPLTFDIVDSWNGRSLGGCRYHVAHPGGRGFETLPVNALEAEGRRLARFETVGHTAGSVSPRLPRDNPDFPHTLDLRRESI